MTVPQNLFIQDYTYALPEESIARYPLPQRDASKLLISYNDIITEDIYQNVADHIPANSLLIFNNTKVVEARLLFQKPTGGIIEIFCLEPDEHYPDITTAMLQTGTVNWQCLVGGASKWKRGQVLEKKIRHALITITLTATYVEKRTDYFIIQLHWSPPHFSFAEVLHYTGAIPLPPYIKRQAEPTDTERYQTIYAQSDGSVAAPTAGLHFTPGIFSRLETKNIKKSFVTLHVGAGTFKPVKVPTIGEHEMHAEFIDTPRSAIEDILQHLDQTIIPVGTTSLRTIESLYWLAVKQLIAKNNKKTLPDTDHHLLSLSQWEAYDLAIHAIPVKAALEYLLEWMTENKKERLVAKTQIIIVPGYTMKITDALITNFHQPQSTLLLLVAALIGENWKKVYEYALRHDFRFLSYGDGSLLWAAKR